MENIQNTAGEQNESRSSLMLFSQEPVVRIFGESFWVLVAIGQTGHLVEMPLSCLSEEDRHNLTLNTVVEVFVWNHSQGDISSIEPRARIIQPAPPQFL